MEVSTIPTREGHPTRDDLLAAHDRVRPHLHRTPVLTSSFFDSQTGAELFFKCENFQKIGAFKARGGVNTVYQLDDETLARGVVTHSSGNHGQAVAYAAKQRGASATIVMPRNAPGVKVDAVRGYGAELIFCEPRLSAREAGAREVIERTGATLIHPFNDWRIICGQATAAMELLEDVPNLEAIVTPVGGGGLLSGTALAAHYFSPETAVFGSEPSGADDAKRSLESGRLQGLDHSTTIADGLRTSLGDLPFSVVREHVRGIYLCDDPAIIEAMRLVWERLKILIEPSCAVPVAVLLGGELDVRGQRVGVILTGGNVDLDRLPWSLNRRDRSP